MLPRTGRWMELALQSVGGLRSIQPEKTFRRTAGKPAVFFLLLVFLMDSCRAFAQFNSPWLAGRYSFSDELGGFEITDVSGSGTKEDPYFIRQVFDTATSVTLVIRLQEYKDALGWQNNNVTHSSFHIQIETVNSSNLSWIGLGYELQELQDKASTYGDGLSFDQLARRADNLYSDRFKHHEYEFEPGDRLIFIGGQVDHGQTVITRFVITDFTPVETFYLFQDPLIPAS